MSARTTMMVRLSSVADGLIDLQVNFDSKASGLAGEMFGAIKDFELNFEDYNKELVADGKKAVTFLHALEMHFAEVENERVKELITLKNDPKMTLTKFSGTWKSRKSDIITSIKAGLKLADFDSFTALRKGKDLKKGTNASGDNKTTNKTGGTDNAALPPSTPTALQPVTSAFTPDKQKRIDKLLERLALMSDEGQAHFLETSEHALNRLTKVGGRFANANVS